MLFEGLRELPTLSPFDAACESTRAFLVYAKSRTEERHTRIVALFRATGEYGRAIELGESPLLEVLEDEIEQCLRELFPFSKFWSAHWCLDSWRRGRSWSE